MITGNGSEGVLRQGHLHCADLPQGPHCFRLTPHLCAMLLAHRLPARPETPQHGRSWGHQTQAGPVFLPGASWISLLGVVGTVWAPVGQHPSISWGSRWVRPCREIGCWGVSGELSGIVWRGRVWGRLGGAFHLCATWRRRL